VHFSTILFIESRSIVCISLRVKLQLTIWFYLQLILKNDTTGHVKSLQVLPLLRDEKLVTEPVYIYYVRKVYDGVCNHKVQMQI
jgi:hypothetical protein